MRYTFRFIVAVITVNCSYAFAALPVAHQLEEVLVTARKVEEQASKTPVTIHSVDASAFQQFNASSIHELERMAPNVSFETTSPISGSSNSSVIYMRGVGQSEFLLTNDAGVGMYVDGVYRARSMGGVMDTAAIEQVEILKGPQGTLFGKNTIGGAINIRTRMPGEMLGGSISTRIGDDGRRDLSGLLDLPIIDGELTSLWGISTRHMDDYGVRLDKTSGVPTGEEMGDEDRWSWFSKWQWQPSDELEIVFSVDGQEIREHSFSAVIVSESPAKMTSDVNASLFGSIYNAWAAANSAPIYDGSYLTQDPHTNYATGPNFSELDELGGSFTVSWQQPWATLKSITAYRDLWSKFGRDPDASEITLIHTANQIDHYQLSQELQLNGLSLDEKLQWTAGLYYFKEVGRDHIDGDVLPDVCPDTGLCLSIDGYYDVENSSVAGYGQFTYQVAEAWRLTAGLRYSDESREFQSFQYLSDSNTPVLPDDNYELNYEEWTPHVGVDWQITEQALAYLSYSEGFKSGGFVTRYLSVQPAPASFKPEYVDNYELGLKLNDDARRWQLNLATFYADYEDIQTVTIQGAIPVTRNAADGRVRGVELDLQALLTERVSAIFQLGYLDAEYTRVDPDAAAAGLQEHYQFVNTPQWSSSLGLQYQQDLSQQRQLQLSTHYHWRSEVANDAPNTPVLIEGPLGLLSARAELQIQSLSVAAYAKNLTDEIYLVSGSSDIPAVGISEANYSRGREWGIELGYQW
jgi:iron complex outermembrane receptor protein